MEKRKTKLLIVSMSLSGGGAERFASTMVNNLDQTKFDLTLCLFRGEITYPLVDKIPVIILDKRKPWHIGRTILRLRRLIEETKPDVILSTFEYISRFTGIALRKCNFQGRWVARIASRSSVHKYWYQFAVDAWTKTAYRQADEFVTNARGLSQEFINFFPKAACRVKTLYNPVDFSYIDQQSLESGEYKISSKKPIIVSMGRLERVKRYDILLDGFARFSAHNEARLIICGQGSLRDKVIHDIKRLGLVESVEVMDFQKNPYPIMCMASVVVLTSDYEGLPNVLIEAQGLGIPVISTKCPFGPEEIVEDGVTGILTPVGDSMAIARALDVLLSDPELCKEMGDAARLRSRWLFDKSIMIPEWEKILK